MQLSYDRRFRSLKKRTFVRHRYAQFELKYTPPSSTFLNTVSLVLVGQPSASFHEGPWFSTRRCATSEIRQSLLASLGGGPDVMVDLCQCTYCDVYVVWPQVSIGYVPSLHAFHSRKFAVASGEPCGGFLVCANFYDYVVLRRFWNLSSPAPSQFLIVYFAKAMGRKSSKLTFF